MVGIMKTEETSATNQIRPVHERFDSLAAYLAWAKKMRTIGMPWYKEIRPGYYRFQPSRGQRPDDRIYSYEDLRHKMKFDR